MKKTVVFLLCFVFLFAFAACDSGTTTEETTQQESVARIWEVSTNDSVTKEVGEMTADQGWGSSEAGVLAEVELELYATQYEFVARLLTYGHDATNSNVVAVIRAIGEDGVELGRGNVRVNSFDMDMTYEDFSVTFSVPETQTVKLQIYTPGYEYARVSQMAVMSRTVDPNEGTYKEGAESLLGVDKNESVPAYEEDALYIFDIYSWAHNVGAQDERYDIYNLVTTLQGLVNRDGVHLFVYGMADAFQTDVDQYWLDYLSEDGQMLSGKEKITIQAPITLLKLFDGFWDGFAVWDQQVPATVNAVATACGVDNLLPLRWSSDKSSLYAYMLNYSGLMEENPVKVDLANKFVSTNTSDKIYQSETNCTGSRKNDVYIWAKEQYLDTQRTNSHLMAYHVDAYSKDTVSVSYENGDARNFDNMYLANRDYYIAEKAFFFDLSVSEVEVANDDPDQTALPADGLPLDYKTFTAVMTSQSAYAKSVDATKPIDVGGFTPWHLKYTSHTGATTSDVNAEWNTVLQFSAYFAQVNADAPHYTAMSNGSVYRQFEMKDTYEQSGRYSYGNVDTSVEYDANTKYAILYFGDFDSSAWLNAAMPKFWSDDTLRNAGIPVCYSFALDIYKRAPQIIDMMYSTASEYDYFVAGDCGTGYFSADAFYLPWREQMYEDGEVYGDLETWVAYNKEVFERFDIDILGFQIFTNTNNSNADTVHCEVFSALSEISIGCASNGNTPCINTVVNGMPVVYEVDYDASRSVEDWVSGSFGTGSRQFQMVRFILTEPSSIKTVYDEMTEQGVVVLDPYTFFALAEEHLSAA